jgi:hypothetical protein
LFVVVCLFVCISVCLLILFLFVGSLFYLSVHLFVCFCSFFPWWVSYFVCLSLICVSVSFCCLFLRSFFPKELFIFFFIFLFVYLFVSLLIFCLSVRFFIFSVEFFVCLSIRSFIFSEELIPRTEKTRKLFSMQKCKASASSNCGCQKWSGGKIFLSCFVKYLKESWKLKNTCRGKLIKLFFIVQQLNYLTGNK